MSLWCVVIVNVRACASGTGGGEAIRWIFNELRDNPRSKVRGMGDKRVLYRRFHPSGSSITDGGYIV